MNTDSRTIHSMATKLVIFPYIFQVVQNLFYQGYTIYLRILMWQNNLIDMLIDK